MNNIVKSFITTLFLYITIGTIGVILYVVLFYIGFLSNISILFYRGVAVLLIVVLVQFVFSLLISIFINKIAKYRLFSWPHSVAIVSLTLTVNMAFLILIPVTLDRSVTIFILGAMSDKSHPLWTKDEMERALIQTYIKDYDAVDRRFDEQIKSGNIEKEPDGFKLTAAGAHFVSFSTLAAKAFHIDTKFVQPHTGVK